MSIFRGQIPELATQAGCARASDNAEEVRL
jgi:hypothetical protein